MPWRAPANRERVRARKRRAGSGECGCSKWSNVSVHVRRMKTAQGKVECGEQETRACGKASPVGCSSIYLTKSQRSEPLVMVRISQHTCSEQMWKAALGCRPPASGPCSERCCCRPCAAFDAALAAAPRPPSPASVPWPRRAELAAYYVRRSGRTAPSELNDRGILLTPRGTRSW